MTFELYVRTTRRNPNPTVAVIRDRGALRFNATASKQLRGVEALLLLTDDTGRVAFRPTTLEDPNGYALCNYGGWSLLTCPAFIHHAKLPDATKWPLRQQGVLLVFARDEVAP